MSVETSQGDDVMNHEHQFVTKKGVLHVQSSSESFFHTASRICYHRLPAIRARNASALMMSLPLFSGSTSAVTPYSNFKSSCSVGRRIGSSALLRPLPTIITKSSSIVSSLPRFRRESRKLRTALLAMALLNMCRSLGTGRAKTAKSCEKV